MLLVHVIYQRVVYTSVYTYYILVVTQQEKENFYIVMKCSAIYIGRTFNLWLLLVYLISINEIQNSINPFVFFCTSGYRRLQLTMNSRR